MSPGLIGMIEVMLLQTNNSTSKNFEGKLNSTMGTLPDLPLFLLLLDLEILLLDFFVILWRAFMVVFIVIIIIAVETLIIRVIGITTATATKTLM
jgi:hypothetical protein